MELPKMEARRWFQYRLVGLISRAFSYVGHPRAFDAHQIMKPKSATCCIPGCKNVVLAYGACARHKATVAPAVRHQRGVIPGIGRKVLAVRVTSKARGKLDKAANAYGAHSAYKVGSLILERITEEDIAKYLDAGLVDGASEA